MPWTARALRTASAAAFLAAGAAGCAPGAASSRPPARTASAPAAPSSPAPSAGPRALAREAYLGMWKAYVTAARTADYQAPDLDHYAAGAGLSVLTHGLYQEHKEGDVNLGQPVFHPVVTMAKASGADPVQASITDCADSSHWAVYHGGKRVPDQATGNRRIIARLKSFGGTWKVTYLNVGQAGTCLPPWPGALRWRSRSPWRWSSSLRAWRWRAAGAGTPSGMSSAGNRRRHPAR